MTSFEYFETVSQSLICPICKQPFIDPVQTLCNHKFCRGCILNKNTFNNQCLTCGNYITEDSLSPLLFLKLSCDNLQVYCLNRSRGCQAIIKRNQMENHIKNECKFTKIITPFLQEKKEDPFKLIPNQPQNLPQTITQFPTITNPFDEKPPSYLINFFEQTNFKIDQLSQQIEKLTEKYNTLSTNQIEKGNQTIQSSTLKKIPILIFTKYAKCKHCHVSTKNEWPQCGGCFSSQPRTEFCYINPSTVQSCYQSYPKNIDRQTFILIQCPNCKEIQFPLSLGTLIPSNSTLINRKNNHPFLFWYDTFSHSKQDCDLKQTNVRELHVVISKEEANYLLETFKATFPFTLK
ncbi:early girl isoform a-related [Anaeramoeba ignava]|uniref:Early girl isoform a-related n=1 Tax=Anaeramoeba ignava TaxID=1746090 RepID=A0A9Q0R4E7_ANAIG|nr:early girl isoform a-related [Anaeramoeba ignava]